MNDYKQAITVIYPAGSGGEFFTWILAQQQDFIPIGVSIELNRWSLRCNTTPEFFHRDTSLTQFFQYITTDPKKITLLRDHMTFDVNDHELLNSFLYTRYDMWDAALIVLLYPQTEISVQYGNKQVKQKLNPQHHNADTLRSTERDYKNIVDALGNRDYITIDPYEFFISDRDRNIQNLENQIQQRFGDHVLLDRLTYDYFIDLWVSHNAS